MRMNKTTRARAGLGCEVLAFFLAVGIAIALTQDYRATALHVASAWAAVGFTAVTPILSVAGTRRAVLTDALVALMVMFAILGSFTIGGLAFILSVILLMAASAMHYLATPQGEGSRRLLSWLLIALGSIMFLGGLVSMSAGIIVAPVGLVLIMWAAGSLGSVAAAPRADDDAV